MMVKNGIIMVNGLLVGGFNHLEKYESQWEGLSHILWKIIQMFPNHQPVIIVPIIIWLVVDLPYIENHTYIWVNYNN